MKKISYAAGLISLFALQLANAGLVPVTMSGPTPAIVGNPAAGSTSTYTYTIVNNVPKSFPITVSGISGPVTRVTNSGSDCGSSLPPGPSTCTIQVSVAPTASNNGQVFNQLLSVDYQGRYPLIGNISFTVGSAIPAAPACAGPGGSCRVFLSTTTSQGDISDGLTLSGPAAATCSQPGVIGDPFSVVNCICNYDATHVQSITGNFHAWLATTAVLATTNINYTPALTYTSIMPSGGVISNAANDLITNGGLLSPIVPNASLSDFAYTGANPDGTPESGGAFSCSDWTTSSGFTDGAAGRQVGTDSSWTLWSNEGCNSAHPFYCFETAQ